MQTCSEVIRVTEVSKQYRSRTQTDGYRGFFRGLFNPDYEYHQALDGINLSLGRGESLGFLGANGAGKSTFAKILCGIQRPTTGQVEVLGFTPHTISSAFYKKIGVVFGHKHSLWWDLPVRRSFDLARRLYSIDQRKFDRNRTELCDALNLASVLERPVRVLSLGERVKCELAMNLLHSPEVLLLDEPTVGLDLSSRSEIRQYLNRLRSERGISIFMTSHDMGDIEGCCENVLLLHQGRIHYDGKLSSLKQKFRKDVKVRMTPADHVFDLQVCSTLAQSLCERGANLEILTLSQEEVLFKVDKNDVNALSSTLIGTFNPNLEISYPDLEEIMLNQLTQWREAP